MRNVAGMGSRSAPSTRTSSSPSPGAATVAVFGATDPARWRPLGPRVELVQAADLDLAGVSVERVAAACRRVRAG